MGCDSTTPCNIGIIGTFLDFLEPTENLLLMAAWLL